MTTDSNFSRYELNVLSPYRLNVFYFRMTTKIVAIFVKQLPVAVTPDSDPESIFIVDSE